MGYRARHLAAAIALPALAAACIFTSVTVQEAVRIPMADQLFETPVKAHFADGSVIVYRQGVRLQRDTLFGSGMRFDLTRRDSAAVLKYPAHNVAALESFSTDVNQVATILGSTLGVALAGLGITAIAVAIFGSCPTVYADAGAGLLLQAETFSMSIAPLFESRDVDRIVVRPDSAGRFTIEIRNEMLETHYINQLQMLAVEHAADELVIPDGVGRVMAVSGLSAPVSVRDSRGGDRSAEVAARDEQAFRSDAALLAAIDTGSLEDQLDLVVMRPAGDSIALVFRMRNSLLNTILLYEELLGARGGQALAWMGGDLRRIGEAAELGRWYAGRMGMKVHVLDGGSWRYAGRLPDAGPIAWKDVAIAFPVPPGDDDRVRIRLTFPVDDWRIDQVQVAARARRATVRVLAVDSIVDADGKAGGAARSAVASPDANYLVTHPGDRMTVHWSAGAGGGPRTFLLAAQGYYVEWLRREWLARAPVSEPAGDAVLRRAMSAWRDRQESFERDFDRARIPVR